MSFSLGPTWNSSNFSIKFAKKLHRETKRKVHNSRNGDKEKKEHIFKPKNLK